MTDISLKLDKVSKSFGATKVLHDIDLRVEKGEFVVFVGPSGCGKSTLLRVIAGLEDASAGTVQIAGKTVNTTPPAKRGIAMVFQSYALYPHLNVADNMTLGLKQEGATKDVIAARLAEAVRILNLDPYLKRRPAELSGGQRQRVAIGRAIVRQPQLFLFDEPLSNLDAALRMNTRIEIAQLHRTLGATMIYVTHDQTEAMTLADRIVVLRDGRVEQIGSPMELYNNPANRFVAGFLGAPAMNFLTPAFDAPAGAEMGIRPEDLRLADGGDLRGTITHVERLGGDTNIVVQTGTTEQATIRMFGQNAARVGDTVGLAYDRAKTFLFATDGTRLR